MSMTAPTPTPLSEQPRMALPTVRLLAAVLGTCVVVGGGWALVAWAVGRSDLAVPGLLGAAAVSISTTAGLLVIAPWIERPVTIIVSMWLAQTVVRLLLTPVVTYLLYSATPVSGYPLALAVGTTYLAAVIGEALVFAGYLQRSRPAPQG